MMALLGLISSLTLSTPTTAFAASKNVNFDGTWNLKSGVSTGVGTLIITNENLTTGTFNGTFPNFEAPYPIIKGQVIGNTFTFTDERPGTVVGKNGYEAEYAGTITGNTLVIRGTAVQTWRNGHTGTNETHGSETGS
jgi:hypothetical protein